MHLLLIEDDRRMAQLVAEELEAAQMQVDVAQDGDSGLELLLRGIYDVAIIDWMLPGRDGPAVCRAARAKGVRTALLMLTARTQIEDRVNGLESGADDYLIKPFAFAELLARVRALARRYRSDGGGPDELRHGNLVMDLRAHSARRGEQRLDLTITEWRLLELLLRHPGQVLTRHQILDYVWSYEHAVQPSLVEVYISYLRRKLDLPGLPDPIQTVRGVGYRLKGEQ
ncbi:response regulator transcription factor [bacterium]|nr:response regulator transcription factor [bacterium]